MPLRYVQCFLLAPQIISVSSHLLQYASILGQERYLPRLKSSSDGTPLYRTGRMRYHTAIQPLTGYHPGTTFFRTLKCYYRVVVCLTISTVVDKAFARTPSIYRL